MKIKFTAHDVRHHDLYTAERDLSLCGDKWTRVYIAAEVDIEITRMSIEIADYKRANDGLQRAISAAQQRNYDKLAQSPGDPND